MIGIGGNILNLGGRRGGLRIIGGGGGEPVLDPVVTLISDTFTDTNNVALTAHTIAPINVPATAWVADAGTFKIASNKSVVNVTGATEQVSSLAASADLIEIVADITLPSGLGAAGLIGRAIDGANFLLLFQTSPTSFQLYSKAAGTYTLRGSIDTTLAGLVAGEIHTYRLALFGQRIICDVDGAYAFGFTSDIHQAQTRAGIACNYQATTCSYDNFNVYQWTPANTKLLVFDGDSLTNGYGGGDLGDYPSQLYALLGGRVSNYLKFNLGANGQTIATMNTNAAANVDVLYNAANNRNYCIIWGGTNDINGGASAATTYSRIVTRCQAAQAAGWYTIVLTLMNDKRAGAVADFNTKRLAVNASILENSATFAHAVAGVGESAELGQTNSPDDLDLFTADKEHLKFAGYGVAAAIVRPLIV